MYLRVELIPYFFISSTENSIFQMSEWSIQWVWLFPKILSWSWFKIGKLKEGIKRPETELLKKISKISMGL